MKLTGMDKALLLIFTMFLIAEVSFAVAIIMGVKNPENWAFGIIALIVIDAGLTASYLKHRHKYR